MQHALSDHATDDYNPDEPGASYWAASRASRHAIDGPPEDEEEAERRRASRARYAQKIQQARISTWPEFFAGY